MTKELHLDGLIFKLTDWSLSMTFCRWSICSCRVLEKKQYKYALSFPLSGFKPERTLCINLWNTAGALVRPKGITSTNPEGLQMLSSHVTGARPSSAKAQKLSAGLRSTYLAPPSQCCQVDEAKIPELVTHWHHSINTLVKRNNGWLTMLLQLI